MIKPDEHTWKAGHERLLRELEQAWRDLFAIHADLSHLNDLNGDYVTAKERLKTAQQALWRFKAAWSDQL